MQTCELVEVHDELGEPMNTGVVMMTISTLKIPSQRMPMTTWTGSEGLEDFVLGEETKNDEPWDREDKVFVDAKLMSVVDVVELSEPGKN